MMVLAALLGAVAGAVIGGFGSYVVMGALGVSDFEGMRAVTAFIVFAPLGAIIGLVVGIVLARKIGPKRIVLPLLAALVGGATIATFAANWLESADSAPAVSEVQIPALDRLPADASTNE
jgi:hypothetical protein